jgi:outer membrane lipoprotein-sorting protein
MRWLFPVGILAVIAAVAGGVFSAKAAPDPLPPTNPAALLAAMQNSSVPGLSGTVVARMSLGLPELPGMAGRGNEASMSGLLSGSHTLRVWYGGPDRQRVALIGVTSETDVFHSGRDVWEWDSANRVATHTVLPAGKKEQAPRPSASSLTPQQIASDLLHHLDPSTGVTVAEGRPVAHRSTYDLVLTPRTSATRIGSVHIAVDGGSKVPLAVQVYARGNATPAIDVAFTDVSFRTPSASSFAFTPPPGATVKQGMTDSADTSTTHSSAAPKVSGSGWTSVVEYSATKTEIGKVAGPALRSLQPVHGSWGSGRLLDSPLLSVLVTSDNRVFVGAVDPETLYRAAAGK